MIEPKKMSKKKKKKIDKAMRLKVFQNIDLCACGPLNHAVCEGICRLSHTDNKTGQVKCHELYHIDPKVFDLKKKYKKNRNESHEVDDKHKRKERLIYRKNKGD